MIKIDLPGADVRYFPELITIEEETALVERGKQLVETATYRSVDGRGKLQRLTFAFGCSDLKDTRPPKIWGDGLVFQPWEDEKAIQSAKSKMQKAIGVDENHYNSLLMNIAKRKKDRIDWHIDREEYGLNHSIASINAGSGCMFPFRSLETNEITYVFLERRSGLWMGPGTQQNYQHCTLPRVRDDPTHKGYVKPEQWGDIRVNLTCRIFDKH